MNIIEEIKQDSSGLLFLKDWLGEGGEVVSSQIAEARANVCRTGSDGKPCPNNSHPSWWERWVKDPIANAIRKELEIKNRMSVHLQDESTVNMCSACGCCIRLKVWTPTQHIKAHTTPQGLAKMPDYCWMKKELA